MSSSTQQDATPTSSTDETTTSSSSNNAEETTNHSSIDETTNSPSPSDPSSDPPATKTPPADPKIPESESAYPPLAEYNPSVIATAASVKVTKGDMQGAELLYQTALLEWVDDAREGVNDPHVMREAIVELWISYANFFKQHKQWGKCAESFENACNDPVASTSAKIWVEYAAYCRERERFKTAQKVYLRALTGDEDSDENGSPAIVEESGRDTLWAAFLEMMRETRDSPELGLEELKDAVQQEHVALKQRRDEMDLEEEDGKEEDGQPLPKRMKMDTQSPDDGEDSADQTMESSDPEAADSSIKTDAEIKAAQILKAKQIESETADLLRSTQSMPPEVMALWLALDGDSPPTRPDPLFSPSPKKLPDTSGKSIVGVVIALDLVNLMLKTEEDDISGAVLLDVSRACWAMTALKEQWAIKALTTMEETIHKELEHMESNLTDRLSVAGAAAEAVKQMNETERADFLANCNNRRQQLVDYISWEFRQLLCIQQKILTEAKVPSFDGPTVDANIVSAQAKICSILHSAFFIRIRVGEDAHNKMLANIKERLVADKNTIPPPPPRIPTVTTALPQPSELQTDRPNSFIMQRTKQPSITRRHPPTANQQPNSTNPTPSSFHHYPHQQHQQHQQQQQHQSLQAALASTAIPSVYQQSQLHQAYQQLKQQQQPPPPHPSFLGLSHQGLHENSSAAPQMYPPGVPMMGGSLPLQPQLQSTNYALRMAATGSPYTTGGQIPSQREYPQHLDSRRMTQQQQQQFFNQQQQQQQQQQQPPHYH